ncbi:MAG: hypothetical protein PQ964_02430 [Methanobacteriaceae archaeon]|jgi:hypothetical protein
MGDLGENRLIRFIFVIFKVAEMTLMYLKMRLKPETLELKT